MRDYVKEFSSLMLDIKNMSDEHKFFNLISNLQPWAQTEFWRQAMRDLLGTIATADGWLTSESRMLLLSNLKSLNRARRVILCVMVGKRIAGKTKLSKGIHKERRVWGVSSTMNHIR